MLGQKLCYPQTLVSVPLAKRKPQCFFKHICCTPYSRMHSRPHLNNMLPSKQDLMSCLLVFRLLLPRNCFPFHLWRFLDLFTSKLSVWTGHTARWWQLLLTSAGRTVALLVLPDLWSIQHSWGSAVSKSFWNKSDWYNPRRSHWGCPDLCWQFC